MDPSFHFNSEFSQLSNQSRNIEPFSIESSRPTEQSPLIGKPNIENTKSSWTMRFPAATVCSSCIKSITSGIASLSSGIKKIAWSSYRAVVSLIKPDQVNYSHQSINGVNLSATSYEEVSLPASGSFKAGAGVRDKLAQSLLKSTIYETTTLVPNPSTGVSEPKGIDQMTKDIGRCTNFTISNSVEGSVVGFTANEVASGSDMSKTKMLMASNAAHQFSTYLGANNLPFVMSVISMANQTAGNTFGYALRSNYDPNLMGNKAIGFPSENSDADATPAKLDYDLKAVGEQGKPDYCVLTIKCTADSKCFQLKEESGGTKEIDVTGNGMKFTSLFSAKITPNPHFKSADAESEDNCPFTLEVLNFSNEYTTALSRGEQQAT